MLSHLGQDIRFALRSARRDAGFFAIAILIVGLGIGANTAIFSVLNPLLLRPLPFDQPGRLVWIANTGEGSGLSGVTSRTSNLRDYRRSSRSFEAITGYFAFFDYSGFTLTGAGEPERLVGVGVARNFLEVLGVRPVHGRNFVEEESVWNGRPAVLLTHGFWERRYGADAGVVGRAITLNDQPATVVGVLPAGFDFASTFSPGSRIDVLTPFPISDETDRWGNTTSMIGRLAPGASIESAQAELDLINAQLAEAEPERWGLGARVTGLQSQIGARFRPALLLLAGAVAVVMLIACVNLSNLLLSRVVTRRREIAVRSALGASRWRLVRQMLTESFVLSGSGALVGVALAFVAVRAIAGTTAVDIPLLRSVAVDGHALLFTLALAAGAGLLFGIVPALQLSKGTEGRALGEASRGSSEGRGHGWLRETLVVSEVALASVLLVGGGLLLRSFVTLLDVDLGFRTEGAMTWRLQPGQRFEQPADRVAYHERLVRRVRQLPGVEAAGLTDSLPLGRNRTWCLGAVGEVYEEGQAPCVFPRIVDPGYLQAMRIPLVSGRHFAAEDSARARRVVILNQRLAARLWPGRDPLGRAILGLGREWSVVGVVGDVRHQSLEEEGGNELYFAIAQQPDWGSLDLVVRGSLSAEAMAGGVRAALREVDPALPLPEARPLESLVDRAVSPRRFVLQLLGVFAAAALLLASVGIYGVLSYTVSQRTREIGIRMALGESAARVQGSVVLKTLKLAGIGVAVGWLGSLWLSRWVGSLLYGVSPTDPSTSAAMLVLLMAVAGVAGYLPARRASQVEPMAALRAGGEG
jgi:predicted permease